jgi:hypothetical protein
MRLAVVTGEVLWLSENRIGQCSLRSPRHFKISRFTMGALLLSKTQFISDSYSSRLERSVFSNMASTGRQDR